MKYYNEVCHFLSELLQLDQTILRPIFGSLCIIVIFWALKTVTRCLVNTFTKKPDKRYKVYHNIKIFYNVIEVALIGLFLTRYISNLGLFVSLIISALTFALRDVFTCAFYGLYCKKNKIFKLGDRIEVHGVKGDVININNLSFDILEVQDDDNGQSTGVIITMPNTYISNQHIKNYNRGFNHVWSELTVKVPIDSDIEKDKKELYRILEENEEIVKVPVEIERELSSLGTAYQIYYNNCKPIIYTNVTTKCVELKIRYLMNTRKVRVIEDELWSKILESNKKGKLKLYRE